jgi:uncharacterized protein YecE (DUF72 family)
MGLLPLFGSPEAPRSSLAARLSELAAQGVYFGASSWKYPGWLGSIYTPERYQTRGRFSQKKFDSECLAEYAETFPAVCGDFSFYQFPSPDFWRRLFHSAPPRLLFGFKVPEEITVRTWPGHARYGARGGQANPGFLDAALFDRAFAAPLAPYRDRVGVLIFEFGAMGDKTYIREGGFLEDLHRFLAILPQGFRYAVEIRNPELFDSPYFSCLREHRTAHVFNAWTRMPELPAQVAIEEAYTADFLVARALLSRGRSYEQAVKTFEPYERVQQPNPGAREALRLLMERARRRGQLAFLFVNNRLEGHAPGTIQAVVEGAAG